MPDTTYTVCDGRLERGTPQDRDATAPTGAQVTIDVHGPPPTHPLGTVTEIAPGHHRLTSPRPTRMSSYGPC